MTKKYKHLIGKTFTFNGEEVTVTGIDWNKKGFSIANRMGDVKACLPPRGICGDSYFDWNLTFKNFVSTIEHTPFGSPIFHNKVANSSQDIINNLCGFR